MIDRRLGPQISALLDQTPAIALLGPRQAGKTTLALMLANGRPSSYLDLESPSDRARLAEPELYLADHEEELVILDEIHRATSRRCAGRSTAADARVAAMAAFSCSALPP